MWQFIFGWFFVRNWYTGEHEISRPRVALAAGAVFLLLFAIVLIVILHQPVEYVAQP